MHHLSSHKSFKKTTSFQISDLNVVLMMHLLLSIGVMMMREHFCVFHLLFICPCACYACCTMFAPQFSLSQSSCPNIFCVVTD